VFFKKLNFKNIHVQALRRGAIAAAIGLALLPALIGGVALYLPHILGTDLVLGGANIDSFFREGYVATAEDVAAIASSAAALKGLALSGVILGSIFAICETYSAATGKR